MAWLASAMVAATLLIVVLRYVFSTGSIVLQEAVMYMHALVFMLGIPYALGHDAHVRVDVLSARLGRRGRLKIEIIGHTLFLLPVCLSIIYLSLPYVAASWRVLEGSSEVGGIRAVFLLKSLIPLTAMLLLLQGLARTASAAIQLRAQGPR